MIRKAYIRNQARKESYLRERRESKKWSELNHSKLFWLLMNKDGKITNLDGTEFDGWGIKVN